MDRVEVRARYTELAQLVMDGHLVSTVEAVYPLQDIHAALVHAGQAARDGKIVLRMRP
jgi:NADPH:quinone reductase-like Zn-dependent oxidoreductase